MPVARRLTRRRFLTAAGVGLASCVGYALAIEPRWVSVVRRDLPIEQLPNELDGRTLIQISDLHVGPVPFDYLVSCVEQVNQLRPDLLVITGDYMTAREHEQLPRESELLGLIEAPPLGTFATLGNHDYGTGFRHVTTGDLVARTVAAAGITVLRNQQVNVAGLQLLGMDELWAGMFAPARTLRDYDAGRACLALSHNPDTLDHPDWGPYRGWVLSGHTHGGQCKAPFLDPPIVPVANKKWTSGEIDAGDGRRVYINRGLGFNKRVRFNARPEITHFTLRTA